MARPFTIHTEVTFALGGGAGYITSPTHARHKTNPPFLLSAFPPFRPLPFPHHLHHPASPLTIPAMHPSASRAKATQAPAPPTIFFVRDSTKK